MMKNRAGVLALVVLAIATILMVFVVLPQMSGGKKGVTDLANKASDAVKDATKTASDTAGTAADTVAKTAADVAKEAQTAVLAKMDRLKADATASATDLQGLFKDAKVPTLDEIAAGKAKAEAALKSVVDLQLPEGMDATLAAGAKAASDAAAKSLALVQAIPADVEGARTAIAAFAASMGLPALPEVAKVADPAKPADAAATTAEAPKPAETAAAPATPATPAAPEDPTAKWVMPSFDIVRVEKDGSMVVAGRGEPGTKLEIMNGDAVIATTDIDQDGNFVAVLDNPLAPGDYSLVLKLTDKNGLSKTSEEVATVSVPKDSSGQLLAMVTKAGEASRILTTPDVPKTAAAATTAPAPAAVEIKTPDLPAASNAIAGSAPVVDTAAAPAAATADATAPAATTPVAETKPAPAADTKPAVPDVVVTAVELEGDKIFVAGTTKPGLTVRAYADDKIVGEAKAEANGAFVADGKMDLSVGTHTIRVDALDDKGNVAYRATVPFNRPEGEQVAVVAQPDAPAGAKAAMEMLGDGKFDQLRGEAAKALDLLKSLFVDSKVPSGEQLAAARSSLQFALKSLAEFKLPENADAASLDLVARVATSAKDALQVLMALPQDAAGVKAGLGALEAAVKAVLQPNADMAAPAEAQAPAAPAAEPAKPATAEATPKADATAAPAAATAEAPKPAADAAKPAATADATQPATAEPKTTEQAPLQESKTSVIIRRGDTLWQISRRVYGKGIRYTTIYLANEDQITNPDKISPGQIFGVPDKAQPDADAEAVHRKHLQQD